MMTPQEFVRVEAPRVGGEDGAVGVGAGGVDGTPPRWREGMEPQYEDGEEFGTPPRRRGGRHGHHQEQPARRNTLASVGRTTAAASRARPRSEHPRVGGEDAGEEPERVAICGTPLRRRGGRDPRAEVREHDRNTAASAGRKPRMARRTSRNAEHPRVGGEDHGLRGDQGGSGTPRVGGEDAMLMGGRADAIGTPPASAGKTPRRDPRRRLTRGTPPRRRGGPVVTESMVVDSRITPASAGRTLTRGHHHDAWTKHPCVGGEDGGPV